MDTWVKLKKLPCDKHIVDIIKNGKGKTSMKILNGHIQNGKNKFPNNYTFSVV